MINQIPVDIWFKKVSLDIFKDKLKDIYPYLSSALIAYSSAGINLIQQEGENYVMDIDGGCMCIKEKLPELTSSVARILNIDDKDIAKKEIRPHFYIPKEELTQEKLLQVIDAVEESSGGKAEFSSLSYKNMPLYTLNDIDVQPENINRLTLHKE